MAKSLLCVGWIVAVFMAIDFMGFALWGISGQNPPDGLYLGSLTGHIIHAVK